MTNQQITETTCALEKRPGCIQAALSILGDKWSPLLLGHLVDSPMTFGELELALIGISPRTLSARLEKLTASSIIAKNLYCKHPPRYRYEPTQKGHELESILRAMATWGDKHHEEVL